MKETDSQTELNLEQLPWYAIRTFNCQEQKVSCYLTQNNYIHFIPMTFVKECTKDEQVKKILVPAVHNLLFVRKKGTQKEMMKMFCECPIPISVYRLPGVHDYCEIPAREMVELSMLCNPEFETSVYLTEGEAEAMVGKEVRVVVGPFKGAVGKLVRKNKLYYFLKTIVGMGVMVRVSRWYCKPL
jgi:hypothetical protein